MKLFGYTNVQLGLIGSLSELAYALGKFINGPLGDRIGGRRIFLIGMLGALVFNIVFTLNSSLIWFICIWCLVRYFLSAGWGGLAKTIGNWFPASQNGTVMGWISINFQFGGVAATTFAGWLVYKGVGWQGVFIYPAIVLFFIFLWSYFFSKSSPQSVIKGVDYPVQDDKEPTTVLDLSKEDHKPLEIIKKLLSLHTFQVLLAYSFLTTFLRSTFFFWTPKYLFDIGMDASTAILTSGVFPLLGAIGTVLLGWYTDHHTKNRAQVMWKWLLMLSLILVGISVLNFEDSVNPIVILVLLAGSGFFLLGPYAMSSGSLTLDIVGSKGAGSCTGLIDGVGYIGGTLAIITTGLLSGYGWAYVFLVIGVISFLSVLCAYIMSRFYDEDSRHRV